MTILIESSIQDVVSTCRAVDNLPKQVFFKHFDDFVCSLAGTIRFLPVCFWKIKVSTDDNWFVLGTFLRSNWKSSIVYRYELDMEGL